MIMATGANDLPHWDLESIFPGVDSPEFAAAFQAVKRDTEDLTALFDTHRIEARDPAPLDEETIGAVEEVIDRYNRLLEATRHLEGYLFCLVETDARNERAQAMFAEFRQRQVPLSLLAARFTAWIGSLDIETLVVRSEIARNHADPLRRITLAAAHLMSPAEEALAAELAPSGAAAWGRVRDDLAARLTARLVLDGQERELPLTEVANLAYHPDRSVRRQAYEAEAAAWRSQALPLAAALNGVKGETNTLIRRRKWADPLDAALFANLLDRPTLDALLGAIHEALPAYRRYLRAKARLLGLPALAWWDQSAPVGAGRSWPFSEAAAFITERFGDVSPKLATLAGRAVRERWIDAEPREGKGGGGFCTGIGRGESRILLNYAPVYDWMSALAHELGHAYHAAVMGEYARTPLQDPSPGPMALAETASTFCETLVYRAALAGAGKDEELALLDGGLQAMSFNVFHTAYLFAFEREVFATRQRRDLSAGELDSLMIEAQRDLFGDALDPAALSPLNWARAPHFYLNDLWFYNFPYAFGMLFGRGLWTRREAAPAGFTERFDDLLASTGMKDAATLASTFGIDLHSLDFWGSSFASFHAEVDRFEVLAAQEPTPAGAATGVRPARGAD